MFADFVIISQVSFSLAATTWITLVQFILKIVMVIILVTHVINSALVARFIFLTRLSFFVPVCVLSTTVLPGKGLTAVQRRGCQAVDGRRLGGGMLSNSFSWSVR
jgi:hypothetical protein